MTRLIHDFKCCLLFLFIATIENLSREKHEEFGDVKKVVTDEFVRQRYLEYVRIPHTEPVEHEFRWGQRAEIEVSKAKILEFMGELHEQDPQSWRQQYREAHQSNPTQAGSTQRWPSYLF